LRSDEADSLKHGDYRGDVVLYYPPTLPSTPENDLYLALAQVQQGSNLAAGFAGSSRRSRSTGLHARSSTTSSGARIR
jgi:hypothetical protein